MCHGEILRGLRDIMIHEYFRVDLELAWEMVQDDVPALAVVVSKILEDEGLRNQGAL